MLIPKRAQQSSWAPRAAPTTALGPSLRQDETERFLARMARAGMVARVSDNRFFLPETVLVLARMAEEMAAEAPDGMFSAGAYNKRSALGRNLAIELLEFFDKRGFSQRTAEGRKLIAAAKDIFG